MASPKISLKIRDQVEKRAKNYCEYCKALSLFSSHPFSVDHIFPKSKGGKNTLSNLALVCQHCNGSKYNKTTAIDPATGENVKLFNPRTDLWTEHFVWTDDFSTILGLTAVGRATIFALKMNRLAACNLRLALAKYGVHPPTD